MWLEKEKIGSSEFIDFKFDGPLLVYVENPSDDEDTPSNFWIGSIEGYDSQGDFSFLFSEKFSSCEEAKTATLSKLKAILQSWLEAIPANNTQSKAEEAIKSVIAKIPDLTDFGIGIFEGSRKLTKEEWDREIEQNRNALLSSTEEFNKVCEWLNQVEQIKSINRKRTSYGLKHIVEVDIGYVSNGVFIAAAVHCGFAFDYGSGPNVQFNMSERSIKTILKRQNEQGHNWVI